MRGKYRRRALFVLKFPKSSRQTTASPFASCFNDFANFAAFGILAVIAFFRVAAVERSR